MPEEARIAVPLLERALALEPNYVLVHGYLAFCFEVIFARGGLDPDTAVASVRHALQRSPTAAMMPPRPVSLVSLLEHDRHAAI